jgi:hypothetical protein
MKVRCNHYRVHFADGRMLELINCATLELARSRASFIEAATARKSRS